MMSSFTSSFSSRSRFKALMVAASYQTLRITPAMEAGFADHVWSLEELVGLLEHKVQGAAA